MALLLHPRHSLLSSWSICCPLPDVPKDQESHPEPPVSDTPDNQEVHPETPAPDAAEDPEAHPQTSTAEEVQQPSQAAVSEGIHAEGEL